MKFLFFVLSLSINLFAGVIVSSPDKKIDFIVSSQNQRPYYSINYQGQKIVNDSRLGILLQDDIDLSKGVRIYKYARYSVNDIWEQIWGEDRFVKNNFNSLTIGLYHPVSELISQIEIRVFNDGVAFRYEFPEQEKFESLKIYDELNEFNIASESKAWWIPALQKDRYEYLYTQSRLSDLQFVHTPLTIKLHNQMLISIHEASLIDYPSMILKFTNNKLKAELVPYAETNLKGLVSLPFSTPWRTLTIAKNEKELLDSRLILNLNDPPKDSDYSWIKTGKYIGIWWGMHLGKYTWSSGKRLGATTKNTKEYIDFASQHGIDAVLVEGWNVGWDGRWYDGGEDFRFYETNSKFDIAVIKQYAAEKKVTLIGHHETGASTMNYESQMNEAYDFLIQNNIPTVKTGYVGAKLDKKEFHHSQYGVRHYNKVTRFALDKKIMTLVHEPIKQTGLRRTYPNLMAAEGARGQEFNAWSSDGGNPPKHTTILPFTRLLAGPMDFTPGIFDLHFNEWNQNNRVNTTLAKQLALYIVIYSPWQMLSDLPENYLKRPKAFEFLKAVPTNWEKSFTLKADIGNYIVTARKDRSSENWYVGAITNQNGRKLKVKLDFLEKGFWYKVKAYQDARDASWSSNPYALETYETKVNSEGEFDIFMAPGGGAAYEFIKQNAYEVNR